MSALYSGISNLQLLIDLEPGHTGTQDQNLGLNGLIICVPYLCLVPADAFLGLVSVEFKEQNPLMADFPNSTFFLCSQFEAY